MKIWHIPLTTAQAGPLRLVRALQHDRMLRCADSEYMCSFMTCTEGTSQIRNGSKNQAFLKSIPE